MIVKAVIAALLAVALLVAGGYGLYRLDMEDGAMVEATAPVPASAAAPATSPAPAPAEGKRVLYWHDPMVPGHRFDKPGKSPFMDMQLVPVYAEAAGDEPKVTVTPRVQQNLGIRTAEVTRDDLAPVLEAVGNVARNERDVILVQARSNGFVERLFIRAPLEAVAKGQPLAELSVPDWVALQEEYLTAKRLQKAGVAELVRAVLQRMHLAGMTEDQIQFVDARGTVQTRLPIYAPVAGVVAELKIREGMTVMTGAPMFTIHGLRSIWVNAEVPEAASAQVRAGDSVEARTPALPGVVFTGEVNALLPEINQATRTRTARIEIANPQGKLVPGMFASVRFAAAARKAVLSVPVDAVIDTGKRSVVMVAEGEGKFVPVDVETGFEASGRIEIRKGLKVGQKVVVSGQFLIDSEASLRATSRRISEPMVAKDHNSAGPNTGRTHRGEGKVEHIDTKEIVLSHGPMPTLQWGAMTMGLRPPPGGMPANVKAGDSVVFDIRQTSDGMFELTRISPAPGRPASPAAAPVPEAHQHNHAVHQHPPAR